MKIDELIISIIETNLENKAKITRETNIKSDINVDSFGMVIIINALEEEFSITIDDADFYKAETISDIISILKTKYIENRG